jgi:hypothetical protein
MEVLPMKSGYSFTDPNSNKKEEELSAPSSRLIDEKISEDSCTESHADSALKPAGLNNPFWN